MKKTQKAIISAYMGRIGARGKGTAKRRGGSDYYRALAAQRKIVKAKAQEVAP